MYDSAKKTEIGEPVSLSPEAYEMKLEIVVIPVSDVNRSKKFYRDLGWRLDFDFTDDDGYSVIQFTPPGSACSVIFGTNVTMASPGNAQGLYLIVSDLDAVRADLLRRGVQVGEAFHDAGGVFHHADGKDRVTGINPQRKSYASFSSFSDPDGNRWTLQEVTARLSADVELGDARFTTQVLKALHGAMA
ncbi:VOC family protein [Caballeronia sp. GAFFF1]|uniref:VOC family protein n=1 Tax=Caballeronia sp. GAFFF1 TaxID=2921779 RepID=UPI0020286AFC|nr:VOC family protein [Caballeronia sp. GAFFF1]